MFGFQGWNQWEVIGVCSVKAFSRGYCALYIILNVAFISVSVVLYVLVMRQACRQLTRITQEAERFHSHDNRLRKEVTRSRIMWIILGVFILCWLPFTIVAPLHFFLNNPAIAQAHHITLTVGIFNSALNCIIYGLRSRDFRIGIRIMMEKSTCFRVLCARSTNVRVMPSSSDTTHTPPTFVSDQ